MVNKCKTLDPLHQWSQMFDGANSCLPLFHMLTHTSPPFSGEWGSLFQMSFLAAHIISLFLINLYVTCINRELSQCPETKYNL